MDLVSSISLVVYSALFIIFFITTIIYNIVNRYNPNYMIKATYWLIFSLTINFGVMAFIRTLILFECMSLVIFLQDFLYVPRIIVLITAVNFLKKSVSNKNG